MTTIVLGLPRSMQNAAYPARIQTLAPEVEVVMTHDAAVMEAALTRAEIAAGAVPETLVLAAPRLRWFQQFAAGADWLLQYPAATEKDFILTSAVGIHGIPISEHIFAYLLMFARGIHKVFPAQARREWARAPYRELFELAGKTILLVGVGVIGERTAQLAQAFGLRVLGIRRDPGKPAPGVDALYAPAQLLEILPQADFVVNTAPLTAETRCMFDAAAFAAMKPSAYFVNIGRGGSVDETALAAALRAGQLAGAGLDVFTIEPLPSDSPLWELENVIITPHYAGSTPYYADRFMEIFLDNLARYREGRPLRNVVDKTLGY